MFNQFSVVTHFPQVSALFFDHFMMEVDSFQSQRTCLNDSADYERLLSIGLALGKRMATKLTQPLAPFGDGKDAVKFICKDLWLFLFRQQASRLQANKRGVFIIHDTSFPLLYNLAKCTIPVDQPPAAASETRYPPWVKDRALLQLQLTCGIIRGFMKCVGFPCSVEVAIAENLPACSFTISLHQAEESKIITCDNIIRVQGIDIRTDDFEASI